MWESVKKLLKLCATQITRLMPQENGLKKRSKIIMEIILSSKWKNTQ